MQDKVTYVKVLGLDLASLEAEKLYTEIVNILETIQNSELLFDIAHVVYHRNF